MTDWWKFRRLINDIGEYRSVWADELYLDRDNFKKMEQWIFNTRRKSQNRNNYFLTKEKMKKIISNLLHYYIFFNNFESIEFTKQIDVILNSIRSFF